MCARKLNLGLTDVKVRETAGRDTISRYKAQFRAAAKESLKLLSDDELDRVYCDFHDDFVTRYEKADGKVYHFYQVKTKKKKNEQWGINALLGVRKKPQNIQGQKVKDSVFGRLILHAVNFSEACHSVSFITNVCIDDDVQRFLDAVDCEDLGNLHLEKMMNEFSNIFSNSGASVADPLEVLSKLNVEDDLQYLHPNDSSFFSVVRDEIFKYSEVDLKRGECESIVDSLLRLVEKKSSSKLCENLDEIALDELAGISLIDVLKLMSISKSAYEELREGGDKTAIKSVSIIRRILKAAGAKDNVVEFASSCKVKWDNWHRQNRHVISEFELTHLDQIIHELVEKWSAQSGRFSALQNEISQLSKSESELVQMLGKQANELLLGAVFVELVKRDAE